MGFPATRSLGSTKRPRSVVYIRPDERRELRQDGVQLDPLHRPARGRAKLRPVDRGLGGKHNASALERGLDKISLRKPGFGAQARRDGHLPFVLDSDDGAHGFRSSGESETPEGKFSKPRQTVKESIGLFGLSAPAISNPFLYLGYPRWKRSGSDGAPRRIEPILFYLEYDWPVATCSLRG